MFKEANFKTIFFHLYSLNMDILLNNEHSVIKLYTEAKNMYLERTMSQIFRLWLSF